MSLPWTCQDIDDACAEVALGALGGDDRAAALAHLDGCPRCRVRVGSTMAVVDRLLVAGPCAAPPAGFEQRVLARLSEEVPSALLRSRRPRRRRQLVGAAAATLLLVVSALGLWLVLHGRGGEPQAVAAPMVAAMVTDDGSTVGKVELGRSPSTVLVALPGWYRPGEDQPRYRLRIELVDGRRLDLGPVRLAAGGTWGGALPTDPTQVRGVSLTDPDGMVLCHARVSPA